jgi:UDP-GlcNAc:undecaprenyl-phosphate GlcNAc-1-phosphate transferase
MGDTGSMFLGLSLAVLSIMGGAKLALAFMVLGVPILDVAVVMINRIRRGQSPLHYDKTHLHYRLMATGLSVKQICYVIYGLSFVYGLLALTLSGIHNAHFYKFIGVGLVGLTMVALIIWMDYRQRGVRIPLGGPESPVPGNDDGDGPQARSDDQPEISTEGEVRAGDPNLPPQNLHDGEASPARFLR